MVPTSARERAYGCRGVRVPMQIIQRRSVVLAILALAALARAAHAEEDVRSLEKQFKKVAQDATPKTVCVRSFIELQGDKAGFGSGAIVSEDGYVLTCAHVIDIAKRCEVILADGR